MTEFTTVMNYIEQIRALRSFDPRAYRDSLMDRALEVYRTGHDTDDTLKASRIADLDGISFQEALLAIIDEKVANKVARQQGKEVPYVEYIKLNEKEIFAQAERALKRHGLVFQQGRKCKDIVKDEYTDLEQACTVIGAMMSMDNLPDGVTLYAMRIGIGNSIYVTREEQ